MQAEIWFRDDIVNALRAVGEAGAAASIALQGDSAYAQGCQHGFAAALRSVGIAFGLGTALEGRECPKGLPDRREVEAWRG